MFSCVCMFNDGRATLVKSLLLNHLGELGDGVEEISLETVVGDAEDRGILIGVDAGDDLGVLHTGNVLDGTGESDGDVEAGGNDLSGLTDLHLIGAVTCLLYTSDAADEEDSVDLGGRRIIKKKKKIIIEL
eukprot:TRINITY_DN30639_c0_g1_i4.p1 TRINITY_DN30639_c0_g1~~TRINITY_DN30639_c0_g1_i4.p1  ORF type:complete len:131 (+),score=16.88 TRINITY_DN30639_c0_g1_i4:283-675(+)